MQFKRVKVTRWCTSPADSRQALLDFVTTSQGDINFAVTDRPWLSKCLVAQVAQAFLDAIVAGGGAGTLEDCA